MVGYIFRHRGGDYLAYRRIFRCRFFTYREKIFNECNEIAESKGKDYTNGSADCLVNFKQGSMFGLTPLQVAGMFTKKHIDAIYSYIRTGGKSESEPIEGRLKDAINYLIFIGALIQEDLDEKT